jgi:hypothetical protein
MAFPAFTAQKGGECHGLWLIRTKGSRNYERYRDFRYGYAKLAWFPWISISVQEKFLSTIIQKIISGLGDFEDIAFQILDARKPELP